MTRTTPYRPSIIIALIGCAVLVCVASVPLHAQVMNCVDIVRAVYKRMLGEQAAAGSVARFRYVVRTTSRLLQKTHTTVANVELIASDTRLYVGSEQMELCQDATTAVTVFPARRLIHISGSNLELFRRTRGSALSALRDSVFATSDVSECVPVTTRGSASDRRVTLLLKPGPRARLKMESVTIFMNTEQQSIQRILFTPTADNSVTSVDIEFNTVDYHYSTDRFSRPLLAEFLDGFGRPLPKYRGYTVTDARKPAR